MPRKKEGTICESQDRLSELLHIHRGNPRAPRIRMLILMCDNRTVQQVADMIDCNEKTIRRWWKLYQQNGLDALLGDECDCQPVSDVGKAQPVPIVSPSIREFLNALPYTDDSVEWLCRFKDGLRRLLGDVDRVSVNLETECELFDPDGVNMQFLMSQHIPDAVLRRRGSEVMTQLMNATPGELLLEGLRRKGYPLGDYHPPCYFDYHTPGGSYLATIFLWRAKHAPRISRRTLETIRELHPFLVFLLSDCVVRRRRERPDLRLFAEIAESVGKAEGLTPRQKEVLLHHLLGRNNMEISCQLSITVNTVRDHIKKIHRKSGTRNFNELFARYFTPLGN